MWKLIRVFSVLCLVGLMGGCAAPAQTIEKERQGLEYLMGQAQVAYSEGRMTDAERYLHAITERYPDTAPAWLRLGNVFYRTGRYDAAIHAYEQALRYDQKNGQAWHNLALTRMQQAADIVDSGLRQTRPDSTDHQALQNLQKIIVTPKNSGM